MDRRRVFDLQPRGQLGILRQQILHVLDSITKLDYPRADTRASVGYNTVRLFVVAFRTAARGMPVSNVTNLASFATARARR